MIGYLFWLSLGGCLGSIYRFCKGILPVTCWAGDLYSLGCPLFCGPKALPCQLQLLLSSTNELLCPPFLTLLHSGFCFYKLTPLTLIFGYRFSHWKLISRLVNTMEPDSKRHAVRSALPAVLLCPNLDLLFVLIEFICLPPASASLFFAWFGEAIVLGESLPYRSTKQTAGFFNLLGSVLLTG